MKFEEKTFQEDEIKEIRKFIIIEQYKRCAEDWRHHDKLLWEIPFTTASIAGAILAIIYGKGLPGGNITSEFRIPILSCLLIFVITMFSLSRKIRFFQTARTRFAQHIERNIAKLKEVPLTTGECIQFLQLLKDKEGSKRLIKYRAVHFQNLLFLSFIMTIIYLLFVEGTGGIIALSVVIASLCVAYLWDYRIVLD